MELYLIRHTQPDIKKGLCYGQSDLPLLPIYSQQLMSLTMFFSEKTISKVYSSPLLRCRQLARDLFLKQPVFDDRLKELNFGEWEMQSWQAISRLELDRWANDLVHFSPPSGESLLQLERRVLECYQVMLSEVKLKSKEQSLAIVTHAGVIRCLLTHLMGMPLANHLQWQIDYGSVSKLIVEPDLVRLCYSNRKSHIDC